MAIQFALNKGVEAHEAESVANESLQAIADSLSTGKFRGDSGFKTFYISIVKNKSSNQVRKQKILKKITPTALENVKTKIAHHFIVQNWGKQIYRELKRLGENCAKIILFKVEGFDTAENRVLRSDNKNYRNN